VDSVAAATGALLGAQILSEHPDHSLAGIGELASLAMAMTFVYSALCYAVDRRVRAHVVGAPAPCPGGSD
jgi:hypothetical protein